MSEICFTLGENAAAIAGSILTLLAFAWTAYQEWRHNKNHGTIKPRKTAPSSLNEDVLKLAEDALLQHRIISERQVNEAREKRANDTK